MRKGDNLVSRVEYQFRSSVGTLGDCMGILARCVLLFQIDGLNFVVLVHTDFPETHAQSHHRGNIKFLLRIKR